MPEGYFVDDEDAGSISEQLLGRGDGKRSTKTFIESGSLAMFLGFLRAFPESVVNAGRRIHAEEFGLHFDDVTPEMILKDYPEARELIEIHQHIVEHKGSQGGFMVDRYVSSNRREEMDQKEKRKESSGEYSSSKAWG